MLSAIQKARKDFPVFKNYIKRKYFTNDKNPKKLKWPSMQREVESSMEWGAFCFAQSLLLSIKDKEYESVDVLIGDIEECYVTSAEAVNKLQNNNWTTPKLDNVINEMEEADVAIKGQFKN